ncbi:hypothetical protein B0H11DRAFT_2189814, partial [Mycena galericulata]
MLGGRMRKMWRAVNEGRRIKTDWKVAEAGREAKEGGRRRESNREEEQNTHQHPSHSHKNTRTSQSYSAPPPSPPIAPSESVLSPSYSCDACAARKGIGPGPEGGAWYVLVLVLPLPVDDAQLDALETGVDAARASCGFGYGYTTPEFPKPTRGLRNVSLKLEAVGMTSRGAKTARTRAGERKGGEQGGGKERGKLKLRHRTFPDVAGIFTGVQPQAWPRDLATTDRVMVYFKFSDSGMEAERIFSWRAGVACTAGGIRRDSRDDDQE